MTESTPQNLDEQGKQAYQAGKYSEAALLFAQAAEAFEAQDAVLDAAEMRNNLSVSSLQTGDPQQALDALAGSADLFAAAGDIRRQGLTVGNEAAALQALKRLDEAFEKYQISADLLEQAGEDTLRAEVYKAMANLQVKMGKHVDAVFSMQVGLSGVEKPTLKQRILKRLLRLRPW